MGGLGKGIEALFYTIAVLLIACLPLCFGVGMLVGWIIWG